MAWTSFGSKPSSDSCRATLSLQNLLRNQLAVGIPKMYESALWNSTCYVSVIFCYACLHVTCCHKSLWDGTSTCKTHWSMVARSCTPSGRSFTWGWTDGPKHWGVGKTLKLHRVQTQELSLYDFNALSVYARFQKKHMNETQRLGKSLEY